ncbi:DUF459 domain-containing protein [uncultured Campylobacter sp.]|uniref:SGNH/GDSL hydrolase family protein n=1 Tax=uncultured Campylobacter sp. TaxID=218934 RepID=UPI002621E9B2|nr:DUF459 domain-containing protein [uncultured Campylobacter sp.]
MVKFISTIFFALIFAAFFMQNSLIYYLEQRFHNDFGLEEALRGSSFAKGGEIYEALSERAQGFMDRAQKLASRQDLEESERDAEISRKAQPEIYGAQDLQEEKNFKSQNSASQSSVSSSAATVSAQSQGREAAIQNSARAEQALQNSATDQASNSESKIAKSQVAELQNLNPQSSDPKNSEAENLASKNSEPQNAEPKNSASDKIASLEPQLREFQTLAVQTQTGADLNLSGEGSAASDLFARASSSDDLNLSGEGPADQNSSAPSLAQAAESCGSGAVCELNSTAQNFASQAGTNVPQGAKILLTADGKIRLNQGDGVLFIGDSLMQYVGMNAKKFFPKRSLKVIDLSKQSTGLASKKSFDWQKTLDTALSENGGVKLVVVLLGANDVWEYRAGGKTYGIKTPRWREFYASRVREIYDTAHSHGAGVFWIAMPCMQKADFEEKIEILNKIYAGASEEFGGYFMQTSPFVCENGKFKTYLKRGSSLVRVRQDDGIHMSKEGCESVAKEILSRIEVE